MSEPNIIVVGSLNADLVQRVDRLPHPGETLAGGELSIVPGGKGANQACAAARTGGAVRMIGRVGNDAFGPMLVNELKRAGVDTSGVETGDGASGTATILVLPGGENVILIAAAANGRLVPDDAERGLGGIGRGCFVLLQLEVPLATVKASLKTARERGATTILDPAPACALDEETLSLVDYLTPNQTEAALLLGWHQEPSSVADAERAARELQKRGATNVILKLGSLGVVCSGGGTTIHVAGFPAEAVDATAAGDTFNGAFAVGLSEGRTVEQSARFANAAAAISVTRHGAQSSIPVRKEVLDFLAINENQ